MDASDDRHPDELALECARSGEADPEVRRHLDGCSSCRARLEGFAALAAALAAPAPLTEVPAAQDAALRALAVERGRAIRTRRRRARWVAVAAAAAVVALFVLIRSRQGGDAAAPVVAAGPADVNRDGALDILDAFALARALETGAPRAEWDFDRDGVVDRRDVDFIAQSAVALDRKELR
jgi:hypothetical protein